MTSKFVRILFGTAAVFLVAATASANLLTNPGFEDPAFVGAETSIGDAGTGWMTFDNVIRIQGEPPIGPAGAFEGSVVLKGFGFGGVFQEAPVSEGQVVTGTAWALNDSADAMAGGQIAAVNLEWLSGGTVIGLVTSFGSTINASTPLDTWTNIGVVDAPVPVGFGIDTVRLVLITGEFAGPGGGAPRFDAASLEVIPVPAAVWLFGSAIGLLGWMRRKVS